MCKDKAKGFLAGIITTTLILSMGFPVIAASGFKNLNVAYDNIKVYINEKLTPMKDPNGNVVEPFVYNGTTYVPLRAISEAFGYDVSWDNNTKSIYIADMLNLKKSSSNVVLDSQASIAPSCGEILLHVGESKKIMFSSIQPHPWFGWSIDKYSDTVATAMFDGMQNETRQDFGVLFTGLTPGSTTFKVKMSDTSPPPVESSAYATFHIIVVE